MLNLPPPPVPVESPLVEPPPPGPALPEAPAPGVPASGPGETHENDVLKRSAKFSWKNFGGDGFMVSVAVHVLIAIIGIFYVVSRYVEPAKKADTEVFATGSGGGNQGDKAKSFEHKLKTRNLQVKTPSRIVSKNVNAAVALPSTPSTSVAAFATGLSSGGLSKGSGGGSGGGEGTGVGIGKGGGKNFVSLFGAKGMNAAGLPGTFYDCKQLPSGAATAFQPDDAKPAFVDKVLRPFLKNWDSAVLEKFFKAPEQLVAAQIFIPISPADGAPQSYGVAGKCEGKRWVAHYKGSVVAPKTGKFRFVCFADDVMAARFNGKTVADGGYTVLGLPGNGVNCYAKPDPKRPLAPGLTEEVYQGAQNAEKVPFRCGLWFEVVKGREYPLEVMISEVVGGRFSGYLLMEEADVGGKTGDGKLFLFRMANEDLPEGIRQDTGLAVDMTGKDLVWRARSGKRLVR